MPHRMRRNVKYLVLESAFTVMIFLVIAGAINLIGAPTYFHAPSGDIFGQVAKAVNDLTVNAEEVRIFNDRNRFMWLCFGGVGGAWVYFAYNLIKYRSFAATLNRVTTTCYITVSFITTVFVTPFLVLHFKLPINEEACGFAGFCGALLAWAVIEIVNTLMIYTRRVAEKRGWLGVAEVLNGQAVTPSEKSTTTQPK